MVEHNVDFEDEEPHDGPVADYFLHTGTVGLWHTAEAYERGEHPFVWMPTSTFHTIREGATVLTVAELYQDLARKAEKADWLKGPAR